MQASVVIVEDEEGLRDAVVEYLSGTGMRCVGVASGSEFRELVSKERIDVVVLDIAMPGEDGLAIGRWLRARDRATGIIFATAAGSQADRIVGLEVGADDYIVKPYELRELLARIRSVARRLPDGAAPQEAPRAATPERVPVGSLWLDLGTRILTDRGGEPVELTKMEGDLLAALVTRPNRTLSRAQLLDLAHGRGGDDSERSIDIRVTRLRKKIDRDPTAPSLIRTVRGDGYMYDPGAS